MKKQSLRKFKLPKRIRLLDKTFKINFLNLKKENDDEDQLGEIIFEKRIIKLDNSLKDKPDELEYVLWHEISHFIADYLDILDEEMFSSVLGKFVVGLNKQLGYKQR